VRPDEAFRVPLESLSEDNLALSDDLIGTAVVKHFGCEQADAAVIVLGVVPGEEKLAKGAGVLDEPKRSENSGTSAF